MTLGIRMYVQVVLIVAKALLKVAANLASVLLL